MIAKSAKSFYDSVGINTHLGYTDTIYWRHWTLIRDRLRELGVSHIRDGTFPAHYETGPTIAARYRELGLGLNLLTGLEQAPSGPGGSGEGLAHRLEWIKNEALTPLVVGIEGSNESWNDATVIRNLQRDTYQRVKADPALASKLVIGPSWGPPFTPEWYERIGDLSAYCDRGNLHSYPGHHPPHRIGGGGELSAAMEWARRTYGDRPLWATETGYWNTLADPNGVSETAAGIYIPRAMLEYFRRGITRTQLYELIDLNTASSQVIDRYGLVRSDGTPKLAFKTLANLMTIVRDTRASQGTLSFQLDLTGTHSPVRYVLLSHSSGVFFLALWSETRVWNEHTKQDISNPAQRIVLNFEADMRIAIYNPATGTTPFRTTVTRQLATNATDGVRVIRIKF